MKLTVLVDNNTLIDRYLLGEPAVSFLIEDEGKKILFDVGYSDAFIKDATKLSVGLRDLDYLVLSHCHLDHTWGLVPLVRMYTESMIEGISVNRSKLITHPSTFIPRQGPGMPEIGSLLTQEKLSKFFDVCLSSGPMWLTKRLVFLGQIERTNDFEAKDPIGTVVENGKTKPDFIPEDSALAYKSEQGLVIITGCSHSGICNIVEYARKVCKTDEVLDIIGGFHLLNPRQEQLEETVNYMRQLRPKAVHACHCTDLSSKIALSRAVDVQEVGSGLVLNY